MAFGFVSKLLPGFYSDFQSESKTIALMDFPQKSYLVSIIDFYLKKNIAFGFASKFFAAFHH